jgi:hypothetical protein
MNMTKIIECRKGQSVMDAAAEAGLSIHPQSPTPGVSIETLERWADARGITLSAIIQVRRDETFAAVA